MESYYRQSWGDFLGFTCYDVGSCNTKREDRNVGSRGSVPSRTVSAGPSYEYNISLVRGWGGRWPTARRCTGINLRVPRRANWPAEPVRMDRNDSPEWNSSCRRVPRNADDILSTNQPVTLSTLPRHRLINTNVLQLHPSHGWNGPTETYFVNCQHIRDARHNHVP